MTFLLDTHALLWWLFDDERLSGDTRAVISEPQHRILVSSASGWEIATKYRLGKLDAAKELVKDTAGWIVRAGFVELPISLQHAERAGLWTVGHRDPFDRMLAAQSSLEDVPLVTRDPAFGQFGVRIVW